MEATIRPLSSFPQGKSLSTLDSTAQVYAMRRAKWAFVAFVAQANSNAAPSLVVKQPATPQELLLPDSLTEHIQLPAILPVML